MDTADERKGTDASEISVVWLRRWRYQSSSLLSVVHTLCMYDSITLLFFSKAMFYEISDTFLGKAHRKYSSEAYPSGKNVHHFISLVVRLIFSQSPLPTFH